METKRSARGTMTRESIADAALAIADRDGFDSVTIRAVANAARATPMALYTYFGDKEALYGGMRDRVFAEVSTSGLSRGNWQVMLETCGRAVFRVLREHPNWMPLLSHAGDPPGTALAFLDELLTLMSKDGLAMEDSLLACASVMSFAFGSALFEQISLGDGDVISKRLAVLRQRVEQTPATYATLAKLTSRPARWRFREAFDLGLRSLISGVAGHCVPTKRRRGARRRPRSALAAPGVSRR